MLEPPVLEAPAPVALLLDPPVVEDVTEASPVEDSSPELFDQAVFWGHEPADEVEEATEASEAPVLLPPPLPPKLTPDTLVQPTTDPSPDDELWAPAPIIAATTERCV